MDQRIGFDADKRTNHHSITSAVAQAIGSCKNGDVSSLCAAEGDELKNQSVLADTELIASDMQCKTTDENVKMNNEDNLPELEHPEKNDTTDEPTEDSGKKDSTEDVKLSVVKKEDGTYTVNLNGTMNPEKACNFIASLSEGMFKNHFVRVLKENSKRMTFIGVGSEYPQLQHDLEREFCLVDRQMVHSFGKSLGVEADKDSESFSVALKGYLETLKDQTIWLSGLCFSKEEARVLKNVLEELGRPAILALDCRVSEEMVRKSFASSPNLEKQVELQKKFENDRNEIKEILNNSNYQEINEPFDIVPQKFGEKVKEAMTTRCTPLDSAFCAYSATQKSTTKPWEKKLFEARCDSFFATLMEICDEQKIMQDNVFLSNLMTLSDNNKKFFG